MLVAFRAPAPRRRLHVFVCACLAALAVLLVAVPSAHAEWDLERLARVKDAAEKAYAANDYVAASSHYLELRNMLRDALAAGQVPPSVAPQAHDALLAATYQLGRTHQLSDNCEGAVTVYAELIDESASDAPLRARAQARLAEAHVCLARAGLEAADFTAVAGELGRADAALNALGQMLATEALETPEEVPELLEAAHGAIQQTQADATTALADAIADAADARRCDELAHLVDVAVSALPRALPSETTADALVERCRAPQGEVASSEPAVQPEPQAPVDELSDGPPWWPGLIIVGVGGATLVGAAVADGLLAGDVDAYDAARARCGVDDVASCLEARSQRGDIESQQDVVMALYITGGVVTAGGIAYTLITALSGSDERPAHPQSSATPDVSLVPTRDGGLLSSWRWRF